MSNVSPVSLDKIVGELKSGRTRLGDYVNATCDRIEDIEPGILALLPEKGRRERLISEASALEERYPSPSSRPPLFGVLLGVKDLFSAAGFETRAGSRLPPELFAMPEASAVTALKKAGCLVLGKTVSTEFAYFSPGPTRNPWNLDRTPGGSSSGSAAAVAAGFCPLALGTQTIGSISRPAAFCGIAGYKPSYGRTKADGAVPFSWTLDHVGFFAASGRDLPVAAPAIVSGWDAAAFEKAQDHYGKKRDFPSGITLAIPEGPFLEQAEPSTLAAFETMVQVLKAAGFRVVTVKAFETIAEINDRHRRIAAAELARVHHAWFDRYESLYSETTAELIKKGRAIGDAELERDKTGCLKLRLSLDEGLSSSGADFWISPSAPGQAPLGIAATGSPIMNLPWTHAGVPTISLPGGFSRDGMPLGLQIAAPFAQDEALLALGFVLADIAFS